MDYYKHGYFKIMHLYFKIRRDRVRSGWYGRYLAKLIQLCKV